MATTVPDAHKGISCVSVAGIVPALTLMNLTEPNIQAGYSESSRISKAAACVRNAGIRLTRWETND